MLKIGKSSKNQKKRTKVFQNSTKKIRKTFSRSHVKIQKWTTKTICNSNIASQLAIELNHGNQEQLARERQHNK